MSPTLREGLEAKSAANWRNSWQQKIVIIYEIFPFQTLTGTSTYSK